MGKRTAFRHNLFCSCRCKKDGKVIVKDLQSIPHILITGKSEYGMSSYAQALILALAEKCSPKECRFCIFDSRVVEYKEFSKLPHLLSQIMSYKLDNLLSLILMEIGRRINELYNNNLNSSTKRLFPEIYVVIDDFSTFISNHEIQEHISLILNRGRSVGIHLILVTNAAIKGVVTDSILSMVRMRISFFQANESFSKRAIGCTGAEKLDVGEIIIADQNDLTTCDSLYLNNEEIAAKIEDISNKYIAYFNDNNISQNLEDILNIPNIKEEYSSNEKSNSSPMYDELLPKAVEFVLENNSCSVSALQRSMKLGYSRAAKIVDEMEELGIIGLYEGAKPREVLISEAEWFEIYKKLCGNWNADYDTEAQVGNDQSSEDGIINIIRSEYDTKLNKNIRVYVDEEFQEDMNQGDKLEIQIPFGNHSVQFVVIKWFKEYKTSLNVCINESNPIKSFKIFADNTKLIISETFSKS